MSLIDKVRELEKKLPSNAVADWQDTNHFELSGMIDGEYEHAWLNLSDCLYDTEEMPCDTEHGKQIGLVLDALALTSQMAQALIAVDDATALPFTECNSDYKAGFLDAMVIIRKAMEQGK